MEICYICLPEKPDLQFMLNWTIENCQYIVLASQYAFFQVFYELNRYLQSKTDDLPTPRGISGVNRERAVF